MRSMFNGCRSIPSFDVSSFDTSNVTNMGYMFANCTILTDLDLTNFNTAKVTTLEHAFYNSPALVTLDLSSFDTSKVTNMYEMCYKDTALTTVYASNLWSVAAVITSNYTYHHRTFGDCPAIVGGAGTTFVEANHMAKKCAVIDTNVSGT